MCGIQEKKILESAQNVSLHIGTEKRCRKCGSLKNKNEFYKDATSCDGYCSSCKQCIREYQASRKNELREYNRRYSKTEKYKETKKRYRQTEKYKEWQKKYKETGRRKEALLKYSKTEKAKLTQLKYHQSKKGRTSRSLCSKRYMSKNPKITKAHQAVIRAIKNGVIKRMPCVICGATKTHGHHEDYNKPLEVIWLCPKHHKERYCDL